MLVLIWIETPESRYRTYDAALKAGAVARGWIPPFVPRGATNIYEVHDIDTSHQWLSFELPEDEARRMVKGLEPIRLSEARRHGVTAHLKIRDWPPELRRLQIAAPRESVSLHRDTTPGSGARCLLVEWDEQPVRTYAFSC